VPMSSPARSTLMPARPGTAGAARPDPCLARRL
jgi:hypothetical protein